MTFFPLMRRKKKMRRRKRSKLRKVNGEEKRGEENSNPLPPKKFVKPEPSEVSIYAKSIAFDLDGQHFCDHYESNGWRVGRNPMKDWKAAVRTWKKNKFENGGKNARTSESVRHISGDPKRAAVYQS